MSALKDLGLGDLGPNPFAGGGNPFGGGALPPGLAGLLGKGAKKK
jgi:hypothetical protein